MDYIQLFNNSAYRTIKDKNSFKQPFTEIFSRAWKKKIFSKKIWPRYGK